MVNHLISETSPYLQQHANNPVDWHPWNAEALRLAREQDKPILLSIGYSACHWCHVMAHESFEDPAVAALMNSLFVNIKVDREERPDLDQVYQEAHNLLMQRSGGWPLTMFLTPDGTPYFGGTYFPKWNAHNLPAFPDVLRRAARVYRDKRAELAQQNKELIAALAQPLPHSAAAAALHDAPLHAAVAQLGESFDAVHGGFGSAPKFPHQPELDFLLRRSETTVDAHARNMALRSLEQMANGGIYDQLGGGFCRYSVDEYWAIPHFEKMLYDNGLLLALYGDAWQCSGNPLFAHVAKQTATWVMREMQSPDGGYYSSLDADSEHQEGKFYVWQRDEIRSLLTPDEYAVVEPHYGLDRPANFEQVAWHLHVSVPLSEIAVNLHLGAEEAMQRLSRARLKLYTARARRIRPGRDEKILASWNGLMITGMARAARAMQRRDWLESAQRAMDFVRATLWRNGRLLATWKGGKAHLNAYLDDHAFLLQAALELLQAGFRREDLGFAVQLADTLLEKFEDREGGFFFTSHDHEPLIQRPKTVQDNATPSGNGIATLALQRMSLVTGNPDYAEAAERALRLFFPLLEQVPGYHASLCAALGEHLRPPSLLVLRGRADNGLGQWQGQLQRSYLPSLLAFAPPADAADLPEPLNKPPGPETTAWLCKGTQCLPPMTRLEDVLSALANP